MPYVRVALDVPLPGLFDYFCAQARPEHVGCRIRVPFRKRQAIGVILEVTNSPAIDADKVRSAGEILDDLPALPADLLALLRFCSAYYHHPIGEVVMAALPGRIRSSASTRPPPAVALTEEGHHALTVGVKRSPLTAEVLERLSTPTEAPAAFPVAGFSPSERRVLRRLIERGWVQRVEQRGPAKPEVSPPAPPLTEEQRAAVAAIQGAAPGFGTWLLHGITGSGKTEVYLAVMADVLAQARQVLFLVPEIGLTPQLEAHIRARFPGHGLVTLHSGLGAAQRAKDWHQAQKGKARIVLGTRSAVFVPLPALGLVVVDEEHDGSYKQNDGVRYSARDLAIWRARDRGIPIILGSATPSLESWHRAAQGRYALARLTRRPNAAPLPQVRLVSTASARGDEGIAAPMLAEIRNRIGRGQQVLVFINRRGYAPVLLCPACAWAPDCPRCAARVVLHKARARLICHHCGHEEAVPQHCLQCGNADLRPVGFGTQRIEAALRSGVPEARLLRIDRDTTRTRDAWPQMRQAIARKEVDLLVGTQLIAKGHDFGGIGLVCVLNADRSLYSTDFRASEHLFAQLLQVAGRAGRGDLPGEVLIQTAFPAHPLYAAVCGHDYDGFAQALLEERRVAELPPFVHQALLRAEASRLQTALEFLQQAVREATPCADAVTLYDPAPAAMPRLQGRDRAQLLVQSDSRVALQRFLRRWSERLWTLRPVRARWVLDVDPVDI